MASSFVQILTAMEVPADPKADASSSAALSAASASGSAMGGASGGTGGGRAKGAAAVEAPPAPKGVMSLMGSITKKLVITPAHDIGVRRRRGYSSHSAPNHAGVPGESVFAAAAVGMNKQYPEDDEVIMMDS